MNLKLCPPYRGCNPNNVTQGFTPKLHEAVDVGGTFGTFLVAPFDAKIERITQATKFDEAANEVQNGCGLLMTAVADPSYRVVYWHCLPNFPVKAGDIVKQGTPVAQMGNTGYVVGNGMIYTVAEREKEYSESTPTNLPKKGVHAHISFGIGDGTADGTVNRDIREFIDWTAPISYDLKVAILGVLRNISKLFK